MINAYTLTLELLDILTVHKGLTSQSLQRATALIEQKLKDYALRVEPVVETVANTVANAATVEAETVATTVKAKAKTAA